MISIGYRGGLPVTIDLWPIGNGQWLEREAAQCYLAMSHAAEMAGIYFRINTSFRTLEQQTELFHRWNAWQHMPEEDRRGRRPPGRAARPGFSTHQSGLSVDINRAPGDNPKTEIPDSPVDVWLRAHAHKYGFVNDVADEPWHWTYLPERAATVGAVV